MQKEDLFAAAKQSIFGEPPECAMAKIGYNVAVSYYTNLIKEAEPVLHNPITAPSNLHIILKQAFSFSSYDAFEKFPEKTYRALKKYADNFNKRYAPLLETLEAKAF